MQVQPLPEDVATQVLSRLTFSPHDFVPGLSLPGDRQLYVAQATRTISSAHDLRFAFELPCGTTIAVLAEILPWDSEFFGVTTARLHGFHWLDGPAPTVSTDYRAAAAALCERARSAGVRYLLAQPDARESAVARGLGESGFALIETRLFYHRNLADFEWSDRHATRAAVASDVQGLGDVARKMVNPFDRFHVDPALDPKKVDELMRVWVENSILGGFADYTIVNDDPQPRAFCTAKFHRNAWPVWEKKLAQPVLSAVSPDLKGWYRRIIVELSYHLRDQGAEHAYMVTQATNKAVVHVWESLGYRFGRCENVFRRLL